MRNAMISRFSFLNIPKIARKMCDAINAKLIKDKFLFLYMIFVNNNINIYMKYK